jgi:adenine/guanine/hypoxanthine permease
MGAGAGYTILTGLFIGLGGIFGFLPFFVDWIPASAVAPILVYIGLEVIAQAFEASPRQHGLAVAIAVLPSLAFLAQLEANAVIAALGASIAQIPGDAGESLRTLNLLGSGFIITAIVWGAATASLIDRRFFAGSLYLIAGAILCLFGIIHSPSLQGGFVLPWKTGGPSPWHFATAYLLAACTVAAARFLREEGTIVERA